MSVVYLHGLGQTPASWESVLRVLGQESGGLCPDLFGLIRGKEVCYENLYQAFSRYCGALPAPLTLCGLSLGGVLALQYGIEPSDRVGALVLIGTQFVMPKGLLRLQNAMFRLMPGSMFSASGLSKADTMRLSRSMMALDFLSWRSAARGTMPTRKPPGSSAGWCPRGSWPSSPVRGTR